MKSSEEKQLDVNTTAIAVLTTRFDGLDKKVDEIKDNHLAHLSSDIKELQIGQAKTNLKIAYWSGGIGTILAILQLVLKFLN